MIHLMDDANVRTLIRVDTLLALLLISMSNHTSVLRLRRRVYATPEDYALARVEVPSALISLSSPALGDPIERSRRVHRNHLENVLPFLVLSVLYALTAPGHALFAGLLWSFLAVRVIYTACYLRGLQPHRTIAYTLGVMIQVTVALLALAATLAS
jgi:uncharacterized MAPEG superfamily protein